MTHFTRAIVRLPAENFVEGLTSVDLGVANYELALQQHRAYSEALEQLRLTLTHLPPDEHYPDSTFVEDTAVLVRRADQSKNLCAILTRPGAPSRIGEVSAIREVLASFTSELYSIREPGTVDGGDICEADDHFFIGISARTNEAGAKQLAAILASLNFSTSFVDIRRLSDILHLKSGIAYLGDGRLAVRESFRNHKEFREFDLIEVNSAEALAANCVRVNDHVLLPDGCPTFEAKLRDLGYETASLAMSEFQKMDGGLSCLSLRF